MSLASFVDEALEKSVLGSFSKVGYVLRKRLAKWPPLDLSPLRGEVAVVTGASSGIGLFLAEQLVAAGADVRLLVRNRAKMEKAITGWSAKFPAGTWQIHEVDTSNFDSIKRFAVDVSGLSAIRLLVHNAGAITERFTENADGVEVTAASQLVGPYLLTTLLKNQLRVGHGRVLWMASGGLYSEPLDLGWLDNPKENYRAVSAYAKVKRAQLSLVAEVAPQWESQGIFFGALHPGWVDTPGLRQSLPTFGRVMGPWLRSPAQGIDTALWLASSPREGISTGLFWFDRKSRSFYKTKSSRLSDTVENREALLRWCTDLFSRFS
jgi:dehydrogenase/reductase SDR family member 12